MSAAAKHVNPWKLAGKSDLEFATAEVQVFAPQRGTVAMMRNMLRMQGFRKISVHTKLEEFAEGLVKEPADLVMVDIDQAPDDACRLVRDVRFRRRGPNPFVSVVATSGGIDNARAPVVVNSGLDDIWLRPTSAAVVGQRLNRLVQARKPFVGMPGYVRTRPASSRPYCRLRNPAIGCAERAAEQGAWPCQRTDRDC